MVVNGFHLVAMTRRIRTGARLSSRVCALMGSRRKCISPIWPVSQRAPLQSPSNSASCGNASRNDLSASVVVSHPRTASVLRQFSSPRSASRRTRARWAAKASWLTGGRRGLGCKNSAAGAGIKEAPPPHKREGSRPRPRSFSAFRRPAKAPTCGGTLPRRCAGIGLCRTTGSSVGS